MNDELDYVSQTWNLDESTAMLHCLSLYHTFGVVATLMSPLSVGGSVVILPQFDTLKVLQLLVYRVKPLSDSIVHTARIWFQNVE